jgi:hypothetical protein
MNFSSEVSVFGVNTRSPLNLEKVLTQMSERPTTESVHSPSHDSPAYWITNIGLIIYRECLDRSIQSGEYDRGSGKTVPMKDDRRIAECATVTRFHVNFRGRPSCGWVKGPF